MFGLLFRCYVIVEVKSNSVRNSSIGIVVIVTVSFVDNLRFDVGAGAYRFFVCHMEGTFDVKVILMLRTAQMRLRCRVYEQCNEFGKGKTTLFFL
jgi:hypothetical protein